MVVIAVMYADAAGTRFDFDYYLSKHIPMVRERWSPMGLSNLTVLRGIPGPDGTAPTYTAVALLTFASMDRFKAAGEAHGKEVFADIPNFTDAKPIVQFNETP